MKHLLNTLFVTSQDAYLALEGETVVVYREKQAAGRFPLHALSGILSFSSYMYGIRMAYRPGAAHMKRVTRSSASLSCALYISTSFDAVTISFLYDSSSPIRRSTTWPTNCRSP